VGSCLNHSLRNPCMLGDSAVNTDGKPHRRGAENAEMAQRVETCANTGCSVPLKFERSFDKMQSGQD
jgi:hypothetical protein